MSDSEQQPPLAEAKRKRPSLVALAVALLGCCFLAAVGVQAWSIVHARDVALRNASIASANMAHALATHLRTSIRLGDAVLTEVVESVERDGLDTQDSARLHARMVEVRRNADELRGIFVYAADGGWLVSSLPNEVQGNNYDREYFQYHLTHPDRGLHIGMPVRSRSTGVWILPLSRRIDGPDGSFAGVALVTLDLGALGAFYDGFDVGPGGTVLVMLDSGPLVYRRPFRDEQVGVDVRTGPIWQMYRKSGPAGTAILKAQLDGIERLYSYRHVDGFPLIVASAQTLDEILAGWRALVAGMSVLAGVSVLLVGWGAALLLRQDRIRKALEGELRRAGNTLRRAQRPPWAPDDGDTLTGLANRRLFDDALQREYQRTRRSGGPLSVVLADVDYCRKYNDRYGQTAGDACLRRVAEAVEAGARRPADLAARHDGETFALLLPDTDIEGARAVAEKIRVSVAGLCLAHVDNPLGHVTVSLGVYSGYPAQAGDADPAVWVDAARTLLDEAKQAGRNRYAARAGQFAVAASTTATP